VAVNCCVAPAAIEGLVGVMAIELSVGAVTVNAAAFEVLPLCAAVMLAVPTAFPVATPAALIVATVVLDDAHVAVLVRFCVLPSEKVPVAVNCCVAPAAIEALVGVMAIELSVAVVTVSTTAFEVFPLIAAVMFDVPAPFPVATPAALIVATVVLDDAHVAVLVRFCVLPSEKVPVAVNACVPFTAIEALVGATAIDDSVTPVPQLLANWFPNVTRADSKFASFIVQSCQFGFSLPDEDREYMADWEGVCPQFLSNWMYS
jgi:hypothetical protein